MKNSGILQFGATGQLGRELVSRAKGKYLDLQVLPREAVDFTSPDDIRRAVLEASDIAAVVNTVAYTAVAKAESEESLARAINTDAVCVLARACAEREVPLVHISTDYVYDGTKSELYLETDRPNPLSVYGRTKLAGEDAIRESGARHAIIRTSWVYSSFGSNFVKTMLRLGSERAELRVVEDQFGSPTAAGNLADAVLQVAAELSRQHDAEACGIFHYAGEGTTNWFEFAVAILDLAKDTFPIKARVVPIKSSDYATAVRRPQNSCLDCAKIKDVYGIDRTPWPSALSAVLRELRKGSVT